MVVVNDLGQALLVALSNAVIVFFTFLPRLLGAAIVALIGVIIGRLIGRLVTRVLRAMQFDRLADRAEIDEFLRNAGVRTDAATVVGALAKWFIYLIAFEVAATTLGIPAVTDLLNQIIGFIPRLVVAIAILLIGAFIANLLAGLVRGSLVAAHIPNASLLTTIVRYGVLAVAIMAALSQLDIAPAIVNTLWMAVIGGIALAAALAFGLGARDAAGHIATGQLLRSDLQPGMQIGIDGANGTIEHVGPLYTSLRTSNGQYMVPNSELARMTVQVLGTATPPLPPRGSAQPRLTRTSEPRPPAL